MNRIAVVTDSSSSLLPEETNNQLLYTVEIPVLAEDFPLKTVDEVVTAFEEGKNISTASPSPAQFEELYQELFERGFTHIFSLHISSKLSSTYQNAAIAAQNFSDQVSVYDTKTAGYAQGRLVLEVLDMVRRRSSPFEISNRLDNFQPYEVILLPRSIEKLKQGGRIKPGAAMVAQLFQIVPWGKIVDGKLQYAGRARSFEQALQLILDKEISPRGRPRDFSLQVDGAETKQLLQQNPVFLDSSVRPIPAVLLAHTGPGALGIILEP